MLPLLLVAASVGLSNLAAAIGIGFGGVTARTRLRVALVFGLFESGMPIGGLGQSAWLSASRGQDATAPRTASADAAGTSPGAMCR